MKYIGKALTAVCSAAVLMLSGCGAAPAKPADTAAGTEKTAASAEQTDITTAGESLTETTAPAAEKTVRERAEEIVSGMTLEQKIAQMIMVTFRSWTDTPGEAGQSVTELNGEQAAALTKYDFGGVMLYAKNIADTEQTVRFVADMQQAAAASEPGIPLFIAADQEGGDITRLTNGTKTCGNMALGAIRDEQAAYDNAALMGAELNALGINTDFAPDLDVNSNPANPVIGVRSFSSDPELAGKLGKAFIEGLDSQGIISTVKHFPGHGDTDTDSHTGLPCVNKSLEDLRDSDLMPFAAAAQTAGMVMTAHIQFSKIETGTYISADSGESISIPATLSKTMITGILRGELGFDGVVITDDMLMDAIKANFDPIDAAVLAINADVDILLEPMLISCAEDIESAGSYISALAGAVRDGRIPEAQINDSVLRIISLKLDKGLFNAPADIESAVMKAETVVGSKEHHDRELETALRAVTLIKNDGDLLPLKMEDNGKVAYFYPFEGEENTMTFALGRLRADGIIPETVTADCHWIKEKSAAEFADVISSSSAVILAVETYKRGNMDAADEKGWQAVFADELIATAHSLGRKVVVMSMQLPYDAARYTDADAILCAYCAMDMPEVPTDYSGGTKAYGVNYPAALLTVFGGSSPTGKLPVDIPALDENTNFTDTILYPFGYGLCY